MTDRRAPAPPPPPVHLDVAIRGVVLPTWVAVTLSVVAAFSAGIVLLAVVIFKDAADSLGKAQAAQTKEIRLLGLYIQDIENVMIRSGVARREDFTDPKEKSEP